MSKFEITIVQVTFKGEGDGQAVGKLIGDMLSQVLKAALPPPEDDPPAANPRKRANRKSSIENRKSTS